MLTVVAVLMALMGLGIAGVWTRDIVRHPEIDLSRAMARARDPDSGSLLLPHWLLESGTAIPLLVAAWGLLGGFRAGASARAGRVHLGLGRLNRVSRNR
jgi:hypothetical protein